MNKSIFVFGLLFFAFMSFFLVSSVEGFSNLENIWPISDAKAGSSVESSKILNALSDSTSDNLIEIPQSSRDVAVAEIRDSFSDTKSDKISVLVWIRSSKDVDKVLSNLDNFDLKYNYDKLNGFSGLINEKDFETLLSDRKVIHVALDKKNVAHLVQSRVVVKANVVETNLNIFGLDKTACVLDTGINYSLGSLIHAYVGGYDFVNNDADPADDNGHGTYVAGIISSNHTHTLPIATLKGIATKSNIAAVKVLNASGSGWDSQIIAGINWCITNKDALNISVISMSLGYLNASYTPSTSPASYDVALQIANNNNIPVVASAGNDGFIGGLSYPAVSPYVISVGATYDANLGLNSTYTFGSSSCTEPIPLVDKITCFSNRASFLDLVAPGASISSLNYNPNPSFGLTRAGTSASAPHVTGTILLMKERNPNIGVAQIEEILKSTGVSVFDPASGLTFKRIDAYSAVLAVPYLSQIGGLVPNSNLVLNLRDPMHPGALYFVALSLANQPGIPWFDGRIIPIMDDGLLFPLSLNTPSAIGFTNSIGYLDSNGLANATLYVPNVPGVQNYNIYSAFVTFNTTGTGLELASISNPHKL
jgi:subtilisin family serine protease